MTDDFCCKALCDVKFSQRERKMVEIRALASSVKFSNSVQLSVCMQLLSRQNKNLSSRGFAIFGGRLKNIKQARWISFGTYDDGRHFLLSLTDSP